MNNNYEQIIVNFKGSLQRSKFRRKEDEIAIKQRMVHKYAAIQVKVEIPA